MIDLDAYVFDRMLSLNVGFEGVEDFHEIGDIDV